MIELNGATGEGGGQILRSALTLSMITGRPFRITNIRANRPKPGLLRQHLVAVQAAAQICGAQIDKVTTGMQTFEFIPGKIRGGDYRFAIGSAGSCTLVLQTLLPALLFADGPSEIRISGGTHNPMAPPVHFLQRAYGRVMQDMGAVMEFELNRFGFYPAGGGEIVARVQPCAQLRPLELTSPGKRLAGYAESFVAAVPFNVAMRELECVGTAMGWTEQQLQACGLSADQGPGNALMLTLEHENVTEVFCELGEKNLRAESVAKKLITQARQYIASGAALGEHLADQVMLPFALAGQGVFTSGEISQHARTNAMVIESFLSVRFRFSQHSRLHACTVGPATV